MEAYTMLFFWGILFAVLVIVEICTLQLVSIWLAAGALVAFFAAFFQTSFLVQLLLFVVVSGVLLAVTRPLAKKALSFGIKDTNNLEIGKIATVIQPINPADSSGRVRLDGVDWNAVSATGVAIPRNAQVRVEKVDGAKLFVTVICDTGK